MGQKEIYDFVDDPTYSHYQDECNSLLGLSLS